MPRRGHSSRSHPDVPNKPGVSNWVEKSGGLPRYIERIAKHLISDQGFTTGHAIASAVNTVKRWARGGGDVKPSTQAKAAKALAEWNAKKAKSRSTSEVRGGDGAVELSDPKAPDGAPYNNGGLLPRGTAVVHNLSNAHESVQTAETVELAWSEWLHPRDDRGRWVDRFLNPSAAVQIGKGGGFQEESGSGVDGVDVVDGKDLTKAWNPVTKTQLKSMSEEGLRKRESALAGFTGLNSAQSTANDKKLDVVRGEIKRRGLAPKLSTVEQSQKDKHDKELAEAEARLKENPIEPGYVVDVFGDEAVVTAVSDDGKRADVEIDGKVYEGFPASALKIVAKSAAAAGAKKQLIEDTKRRLSDAQAASDAARDEVRSKFKALKSGSASTSDVSQAAADYADAYGKLRGVYGSLDQLGADVHDPEKNVTKTGVVYDYEPLTSVGGNKVKLPETGDWARDAQNQLDVARETEHSLRSKLGSQLDQGAGAETILLIAQDLDRAHDQRVNAESLVGQLKEIAAKKTAQREATPQVRALDTSPEETVQPQLENDGRTNVVGSPGETSKPMAVDRAVSDLGEGDQVLIDGKIRVSKQDGFWVLVDESGKLPTKKTKSRGKAVGYARMIQGTAKRDVQLARLVRDVEQLEAA